MFLGVKSPFEVQTKVIDIFLLKKMHVIYVDWWAGFFSCGECDMEGL
jgi:hypothetical protein